MKEGLSSGAGNTRADSWQRRENETYLGQGFLVSTLCRDQIGPWAYAKPVGADTLSEKGLENLTY